MQFLENEIPSYYKYYIELASNNELLAGLTLSFHEFITQIDSIPSEKENYTYADGKWTVKELLLHIIDTERVFQYRAVRFARNDKTMLPGFDENIYAANSFAKNRTLASIKEEFLTVRRSTITLFSSFSQETLLVMGNASNQSMSVRALGYVIIGHQKHHFSVLNERYL